LANKYIAIDLGLKRIGLAYSAHADIVTPLPAVIRKNRNQASDEVRAVGNRYCSNRYSFRW